MLVFLKFWCALFYHHSPPVNLKVISTVKRCSNLLYTKGQTEYNASNIVDKCLLCLQLK